MAPEALRKDFGRLHRRRVSEIGDDDERPDREPPAPAFAGRVVLGIADHLDDAEDRLPHGRVEDGLVATLDRGSLRRRVRANLPTAYVRGERPVAPAANQEPAAKPLVRGADRWKGFGENGRFS
jgi:hypothetical protein